MFANYGPLSTAVYDLSKPIGYSINGDIEYYLKRLTNENGTILEAGVGSGRFFIPLLEHGYQIEGIDQSKEMLALCQKNCEERQLSPILYEGSFSDYSFDKKYDVIVIPTGSFCLIDSITNAIQTITHFYQHLAPGGRLILDLVVPSDFVVGEQVSTAFPLTSEEGILLKSHSIAIDWINQTTLTYLTYEKWRNGQLMASELQSFGLRWYGITEFTLLLEKIGFSKITCSADYEYLKPASSTSQLLTFEAYRI